MVTIIFHCPHCQSEALVRNGHTPNGKQLYRGRVCARQSRENLTPPTHIRRLAARRFCMPIKNAAVYAASRARLASLGPPCRIGSKKELSFPVQHNLAGSRSSRCRFHHAGTRRTAVICAQKSQPGLGMDYPVPQDPTGRRLHTGCSEPARRVNVCGRPFDSPTATGIASRSSG